jgi:hypothetical protein
MCRAGKKLKFGSPVGMQLRLLGYSVYTPACTMILSRYYIVYNMRKWIYTLKCKDINSTITGRVKRL